jgi:arylsulfatase A-like enzyme
MEPHSPYVPPQALRARLVKPPVDDAEVKELNARLVRHGARPFSAEEIGKLEGLYDAEVASLDGELRKTFAALKRQGLLDDAIVVFTADHGEEFHEHGHFGHGQALFEEGVRVPLIFVGPGIAAGRVDENVSLVDVAPTLLDLLGLQPQPSFEGRSLAPMMRRGLPALFAKLGRGRPRDVIMELPPTGSSVDSASTRAPC